MKNTCPFCGAIQIKDHQYWFKYECRTFYYKPDGEVKGSYSRSGTCKDRQLAQQTELLRRAEEVVKSAAHMNTGIGARKTRDMAQALLPELEKALGGTNV